MSDLSTPSPNPPPSNTPSTSASSNPTPSTDSPPITTSRPFPTRTLATALFVACPMLILAPPRKLDFYTFSLTTAWLVSAQKLYVMDSHKLPTWITRRRPIASGANEEQADETSQSVDEATSKSSEGQEKSGVVGMARRLWMGNEQPGWQQRRLREEKEKLEAGESYAGLIGDTIMEAFGAAKKTEEDPGEDTKGGTSEKEG